MYKYYTDLNVFNDSAAFQKWIKHINTEDIILEPFAGSGLLGQHLKNLNFDYYDISPDFDWINKNDSIAHFPRGYNVCITNPPYKAKNKTKELTLKYEDLYLDCLELALNNCKFVSFIIPATFFNQKQFKKRLLCWDKQDRKVFNSTDTHCGVAYFIDKTVENTCLYINGEQISPKPLPEPSKKHNLIFNPAPPHTANYLLFASDTHNKRIRVEKYKFIESLFSTEGEFKKTNRNIVPFFADFDALRLNSVIMMWREETQDFYLTPFKSVNHTGRFRKRITFKQVRQLSNFV